jgi:hypothetical protein
MKNKKIVLIIIAVVFLAGAFYGGMAYGKSSASSANAVASQSRTGQFGGNRGNRAGGGFVSGDIISKDNDSITVKIVNNDPTTPVSGTGSKIIFLDTSTMISKTTTGSINDLAVGQQVSLTGTPNTDGSVTAKTIQIRPQSAQNAPAK